MYTNEGPPGFGGQSSAVLASCRAGEEISGVPYCLGPTVPRLISICWPTRADTCCPLFAKLSDNTPGVLPCGERFCAAAVQPACETKANPLIRIIDRRLVMA